MMSVSSECCAYGCRNRPDYKVPGITFHSFPKDQTKRKAWIESIREKSIQDFEPSNYAKVCSEHFTEECFDRSKKRVFLLAHAIPTIFETPQRVSAVKKCHPLTKIYSNGAVKRTLPESEDEDDVIFGEHSEDEDEYPEKDTSSSESSAEESGPEVTPQTEVVYVSEEALGNNKPSIIKVVPERSHNPPTTIKVHGDIAKALEAYSKMKKSSSPSTSKDGEVSLVMLQQPTSLNDTDDRQVLTPRQLVEYSPEALNKMYDDNIRELKTARQKSRRYKAKIARLEQLVKKLEKGEGSAVEEEDPMSEEEQIEADERKNKGKRGGSEVVRLEVKVSREIS